MKENFASLYSRLRVPSLETPCYITPIKEFNEYDFPPVPSGKKLFYGYHVAEEEFFAFEKTVKYKKPKTEFMGPFQLKDFVFLETPAGYVCKDDLKLQMKKQRLMEPSLSVINRRWEQWGHQREYTSPKNTLNNRPDYGLEIG